MTRPAASTLELVCPAGSPAMLKAAIDAGADSVYCGFRDETNARNFPGLNFSPEGCGQRPTGRTSAAPAFSWR